ncbi:MAG: hypothetical protein P4L39_10660 [Humidesulfovibrio sp.]|nr:hypothetical protein [Humidesulfovibrio sp.]
MPGTLKRLEDAFVGLTFAGARRHDMAMGALGQIRGFLQSVGLDGGCVVCGLTEA